MDNTNEEKEIRLFNDVKATTRAPCQPMRHSVTIDPLYLVPCNSRNVLLNLEAPLTTCLVS